MYFPYLRGKQFDLLALRDLSPVLAVNREKISPIIEPVKDSTSLRAVATSLADIGVNFNVVLNPTVGDFSKIEGSALGLVASALEGLHNYQIALIVDSNTFTYLRDQFFDEIVSSTLQPVGVTFIHNEVNDDVANLQAKYETRWQTLFNVVNFKRTSRRYYREFEASTLVSLDDYFLGLVKNAAYLK